MRSVTALALVAATSTAFANGRPPLTNGVHFRPGDPHSLYVATTFGLLVSHDDGCTMSWVCEGNIGYGGEWDPKYAIAADGSIFATTFTGLRISRDGGCSFTTATAELAPGTPNRIADLWIDALDIGPTGDVWVGTAESGQPNDVFVSMDNGASFMSRGLLSSTIWWKSVKVAASNMARVYAAGYEVAPPTAHLERTDNLGGTWHHSPLTNVTYGSTPIVLVAAIDPLNPDVIYLNSVGAALPGDKLYRSTDGGDTFTEVLSSADPIKDVVIRDANTVFVTTMTQSGMTFVGGPVYKSTTAGTSFDHMTTAPQLACLGIAPGGDLIGCAANWQPDYAAIARSIDNAASFTKVWRFVELAGPLQCPANTAEYETCDQGQWPNIKQQFGATGPSCGVNTTDSPGGEPPAKRGGCCDSGGSAAGPIAIVWTLLVGGVLLRRRPRARMR